MGEVAFEARAQHFVSRQLDVVLDTLELEALLARVVHRVARTIVEVARLADRADTDDVLPVRLEAEVRRWKLLDAAFGERENLTQVRVADKGDVPNLVPYRQALSRLLGGKD